MFRFMLNHVVSWVKASANTCSFCYASYIFKSNMNNLQIAVAYKISDYGFKREKKESCFIICDKT